MKNKIISMNTDKLGLSEEKANEYVNSLVPKDKDVFTKQQMIDLGISNNIPEEFEKMKKENRFDPFVVFIWSLIVLGTILWTLGIIYLIQKTL